MEKQVIYSTEPEDFYYTAANVPCQAACPAATNIPAYIRALYEDDYARSYEINRLANILPGVLGRVCSRPCEDKCRHGEAELGHPVNICHIKRAAADLKQRIPKAEEGLFASLGKKVAVVGSGPAGLAAAHDLSTIGFSVTIFEVLDKAGGMLRYGIPEFRLPREVLDEEIGRIIQTGTSLKTGVRIGEDIAVGELLAEFDAVLLAAGCYKPIPLNVPGSDLQGVFPGLDFMMDVCALRPPVMGECVLVIGAGFTAFDCARSALRLGARNVSICLRRTEEDLAVTRDEVLETKKEGIKIQSLMLSRRVLGKGRVEGVEFVRTRPGDAGPGGKRAIIPIEGSEFIVPADAVIVATGQRPEPMDTGAERDGRGVPVVDRESFRTGRKGLYVAGDYLTGPSTVIQAVGMGRRAAEKIAGDLTGRAFREKVVRMEDTDSTDRQRPWDYLPRQEMPTLRPIEERFKHATLEVETGFTVEQAKEESKRCYLCYLHYEIDLSRCIYCRYCIDVAPRDCIKLVKEIQTNEEGAVEGFVETTRWREVNAIVIDNSRCIRCGECMRVCPVNCISVTQVELIERSSQEG
jgi:NADPH-dependent glutamate synthase beta subunit-like oxidoreductase/formate hydrogenlyase subunit 6/NADH:ubiquinone oxidoreductase subunit I